MISTLSIAAVFNPLRRRIQDFIDRRFFRSNYDAERIMAELSASIRSEVDLDQLSAAILEIVHGTMHPEKANLCLITEKLRRKTYLEEI